MCVSSCFSSHIKHSIIIFKNHVSYNRYNSLVPYVMILQVLIVGYSPSAFSSLVSHLRSLVWVCAVWPISLAWTPPTLTSSPNHTMVQWMRRTNCPWMICVRRQLRRLLRQAGWMDLKAHRSSPSSGCMTLPAEREEKHGNGLFVTIILTGLVHLESLSMYLS